MIFDAARLAFGNLFAPETRSVLWKVIGLALLVLVGLWLALRESFIYFALPFIDQWMPGTPGWAGWLTFVLGLFASFGLALGLALLMAPVTALIAGFFLDDVAEAVERRDYPADPPGRVLPLTEAMVATIKFLGVIIIGNLCALFLLLIPGINLIAFFAVNAYLLSREYFEFAAMRHLPPAAAREFRAKHSRTVLAAGIIIAVFLAVPILNLTTPLFAGAMMVHLYKRLAARDPEFARIATTAVPAKRN